MIHPLVQGEEKVEVMDLRSCVSDLWPQPHKTLRYGRGHEFGVNYHLYPVNAKGCKKVIGLTGGVVSDHTTMALVENITVIP